MAEDSNNEKEEKQQNEEDAEENQEEQTEVDEDTEEDNNEDEADQEEEGQSEADDGGDDESAETEEEEEDEDEGEDVEVPEKFADIIEEIEEMPVIELNELVSLLEKKWGVSAQAVAAGGGGDSEEEEEKDAYDIELTDFGDSKISVIKQVKASLGLGLKEAKSMVEDAPVVLKEGVPAEDAEEMKEKVEEEGGTIELK
jgi:large subunit ribosomal protein L7/L12